jgi:DNA-binding MarR family transcriptional regulator
MAAKGPEERSPVTPDDLDPVIHERVRLSITSVLAARRHVDYLELRTLLALTDGNLAGHLKVLERAGYVDFEKSFVDRKTRTTYALTAKGRKAFERHVEVLASLLPRPARRR